MGIPKDKAFTSKQVLNRARLLKRMDSIYTGAGRVLRKAAGQELFLVTAEGKIRVLAYNMDRPEKLPLYINIHGGGFILGHAEMDDPYMKNVAVNADVKILNIDYSLAPEAPFPKALNECYAVVKYAKEHAGEFGIDPNRIAVGGHSAGGTLSASVCLMDADKRELGIKCLILDYPALDLYTDSYLKPQPKGALPPGLCRLFNKCYCGGNVDKKDPLVSPLYATPEQLRSFPPTLIITAGHDSLCAEAEEFGNKLQQAGVSVAHKCFKDSFHGFTLSRKPDAVEGWRMMIDYLNQCLHH